MRQRKAAPITGERLRELLDYNPETGVFHWKVGGKRREGHVAGTHTIDKPSGSHYLRIGLDGTKYRAHALSWFWMTGEWPANLLHINGDRCDNRLSNLKALAKPPAPPRERYEVPSIWSAAHVEMLTDLWKQGLSCGKIAKVLTEKLGVPVTRSAVIGKSSRMKLPRRVQANCVIKPATKRNKTFIFGRPKKHVVNLKGRGARPEDSIYEMTGLTPSHQTGSCDLHEHPSDPPPEERIKTPEAGRCLWPFGSGQNYSYCGRERHHRSYCRDHAARAFQPLLPPIRLRGVK